MRVINDLSILTTGTDLRASKEIQIVDQLIMKEILFVCEGNVGRSQMAEGFYKHYRGNDSAISAGVTDAGAKYNNTPRQDIVSAMKERGIDISDQRIKPISEEMLDEVQDVVVLCDPTRLPPFLQEGRSHVVFKPVQDPFESSMDGVREVRDSIEKIILELINERE